MYVYPIDVNPIVVYPIEAYLIGKGVVEVSGCHPEENQFFIQIPEIWNLGGGGHGYYSFYTVQAIFSITVPIKDIASS
jgi:hypothetical protein